MTAVSVRRPAEGRGTLRFWSIVAAWAGTWLLISWLTIPALDPYGDMVENYAWSQTLAWGTFKHPPMLAWIVRAWFAWLPTSVWFYYLLSYVNAAVGVLGIVCLARLWLPPQLSAGRRDAFLTAVLLFAILSFPYSNLAAKFNADTVQLSLWPWTAWGFFAAVRGGAGLRRVALTVSFAAIAAAAMLAKYYSALLLASLFVVSLSHRDYRRWYRTTSPYLAAAVFILLVLPHAVWEIRHGFPFLQYLETKVDPGIDPGRMALFVLSGIYYLPVSWLAWLLMRNRFAAPDLRPVVWPLPRRGLALVAILPALFTAASNLFTRVHLTTHWAIPIWFAIPVLQATWLLPRLDDDFDWPRLTRLLVRAWAVLLIGAFVYTAVLSATANPRYSLGRPQMVRAIETRFAERFPGQRLSWAGGTWPESGALAFFAADHPRALPGFPDERRALANPFPSWPGTHGVLLCFASGALAREGSHDVECEQRTREWLRAHQRPIDEQTLRYRAAGWRFIAAQPKNVTVFWVPPRF